jgi:hypothetical protein
MRTWRLGASLRKAAQHVAESIQAWAAGSWYDFAITNTNRETFTFLGRVGVDLISGYGTANVGYWAHEPHRTRDRYRSGAAHRAVRF